jgi:predicted GNAT family N-acyltransferase
MSLIQCMQVEFGTPEYDDTVRLRYEVLRQPLGLNFEPAQLAEEHSDYHLAAYDVHWHLVGCLILTPLPDAPQTLKMRQVAVAPNTQRTGVGRALVRYSETFALDRGYTDFVLNARDTAIPFYLNMDYQSIGEPFEEVGIPHRKMVKKLG